MFEGDEEAKRALSWISERLSEKYPVAAQMNSEQRHVWQDLSKAVALQLEEIKAQGYEYDSNMGFYDDLWDRFIFSVSGVWPEDADDNWEPPFLEGEWELEHSKELDFGYSPNDCLISVTIPKGGGVSKMKYRSTPDPVVWRLQPVEQKGQTFYIGTARACEIDAVCSVPQLPAEMKPSEAAERVLDKQRGSDQWQRRVDAARVESIARFISKQGNLIVNSALLFCSDQESVTVDDDGVVTIEFSKFLNSVGGGAFYLNHKKNVDMRPIWLIDGQHRTRGLCLTRSGVDLEIPIIFFPPGFDLSQSAKIFAEINTLQKKLSPLHTLFMQHRFSIPSPIKKRDFRREDDGSYSDVSSYMNHMSYECAAALTANKKGPLHNRVKILDSPERSSIIKASQWVDFSRTWWAQGSIFSQDKGFSQDDMNTEVENYFRAIVETCNHEGWKHDPDPRDRWNLKANYKGLIQKHGPAVSLLRIFSTVWKKARALGTESPIPKEYFLKVLEPLKWVDWIDPRLSSIYYKGGEPGRNALTIWMLGAINEGVVHGKDAIMSDEWPSGPGTRILAGPANSTIEITKGKDWPEGAGDKALTLRSSRPANTFATATWTFIDSNRVRRINEQVDSKAGYSEYVLRESSWMKDIDSLDIRVDWTWIKGEGFAEKKLKKPKAKK